jgi:hypothetical protein
VSDDSEGFAFGDFGFEHVLRKGANLGVFCVGVIPTYFVDFAEFTKTKST